MTYATQTMDVYGVPPERRYRAQTFGAIATIILIPALSIVAGQAGILRLVFPLLSVVCGAVLLWRSKPLYVGYVFWLWFLTPFLRRMSDFQGGWSVTSAVLLAPYIAAAICGLTLLPNIGQFWSKNYLPFVSALVAVIYGFIIGLVKYPLFNVLQAMVNWFVPVIFGLFIYENRRYYAEFRRVIERSFLAAVFITGAYGIYQFFVLPDWDKTWMLNVQMNSFGMIEAMKIRVFSTMNAPTIFGAVMACGLLILFNLTAGKLRIISAALGFLGLILTMSRSSWLSLVGGVIYLLIKAEMKQRVRLVVAIFACVVFLGALTAVPAVDELVMQRLQSFSDPSHDVSFSARVDGHLDAMKQISGEPWGEGLGSTDTDHGTEGDDDIIGPHDSTPLEFLYSLGWIGTLIYGMGLGALALGLKSGKKPDPFQLSCNAILIGFLAQCLLNSVMLGVLGFMVWTFGAMSLARSEAIEADPARPAIEQREADYAAV